MKKLTALLMALCAICAFAQEKQDAEKKIEIPADKEILQIKLPRPLFSGTPRELRTPNLEPTRKAGEKRPPIIVPKGLKNLAFKKEVTSSDSEPVVGELECITDGNKDGVEGSYVELSPGKQWVQIDLGKKSKIYAVCLWHFHSQARVYRDIVIQTADDPDFIMNVKTIFNNDHDNSSGLGRRQRPRLHRDVRRPSDPRQRRRRPVHPLLQQRQHVR